MRVDGEILVGAEDDEGLGGKNVSAGGCAGGRIGSEKEQIKCGISLI